LYIGEVLIGLAILVTAMFLYLFLGEE
jgi:hypothetical protein